MHAQADPQAGLVVGALVFPRMTLLDLAGPLQVFARFPQVRLHLLWTHPGPVATDTGLAIQADTALEASPPLDLLFVPGGPGQVALMDNASVLAFVRRQGGAARYVTSVCTGALVLGAAGLLRGYRAATHWTAREQLALFGAEAVDARVVIDRNRITGGGVTAGIDFGLVLMGMLYGPDLARRCRLGLEYEPAPPYEGGSPATALPEVVAAVRAAGREFQARRLQASQAAAARLVAGEGAGASP